MNAFTVCLCLTLLPGLISAEFNALQFTNCGDNSVLEIDRVDVNPVPVELPGALHFSVDGRLKRPVGSSSLSMSLKRETFLGLEVPIPCLFHFGSCTYSDICTLFETMISENWAGVSKQFAIQLTNMLSSYNVNTSLCPQPAQELHIHDYVLRLPDRNHLPSVLTWFAAGDYHVVIKVTENATGKQIMCLDMELTLKQHEDPNSGGGFLFGRR